MTLKIFLSHAWRDKDLAAFKAIETALRNDDHDVWVDKREIEYGEAITPELDAAITEADVILVLWSDNAQKSKAVCHEIDRAVAQKKPLVPCKISTLEPGVHEPLRDRKYLRFDANLEFGLLQLSQFLTRMRNRRHAAFRADASLQEQISALNEALVEIEDSVYRREMGLSGNKASGSYINAMLEAGKKLIASSASTPPDEKARVAHFMSLVQDIALEHPDPNEDAVKEAKMLEAISEADPRGQSPMLQMLRQALAQRAGAPRSVAPSPAHAPPPLQTTSPNPPPIPTTVDPPPMPTPLHAHIATVRQSPTANAALRQRLQQLLPGVAAAQIPAYEAALNQAIDAIPQMLGALAESAQHAGIAHLMAPLLQQAQGYFFEANDLMPDHHGTLGLLDDAYLVHAFLYQVNFVYQGQTGVPLIAHDPSQTLQILRAVLGPQVTQQLDQAVVGAVNQVVQQSYYQQMAQQRASMNAGGRRTGGPGSWGGAWEDEMARMGAELGISFN